MVSDLKTFAQKGCKINVPKKVFFQLILICSLCLNVFFAPISSQMSKLFRYSKSLWKSNGKKWSQIVIFLLIKSLKSPRKKSFFFGKFCPTIRIFLVLVLLSSDALSPVCEIFVDVTICQRTRPGRPG